MKLRRKTFSGFVGADLRTLVRCKQVPESRRHSAATRACLFFLLGNSIVVCTSGADGVTDTGLKPTVSAAPQLIGLPRVGYLSVKDFGAVGDGNADDTRAIQSAVDAAMTPGSAHTVFLPAGRYKTTDTIHLGYGEGRYSSVIFEGDGYMYSPASADVNGTAILPTFSDRPCINVQGARGSIIRGVAISGRLRKHIDDNHLGSVTEIANTDDTIPTNWDDPALAETQDSQYAPYSAITIDAYSGNVPAIHYPAPVDPRSPNRLHPYNRLFSSDVLIEDCFIEGFTVGVANQPCDADANGDFTSLRHVSIARCKWGISVGNTQSRNVHLDSVKFAYVYCCLTNRRHGRRQGKYGGTITDMSASAVIELLDMRQYESTMTFLNLYAEGLWKIGTIEAPTAAETPILFISSSLNFQAQTARRGIPSAVLDGSNQPIQVRFNGCAFGNYPSVLGFFERGASFDDCSFEATQRKKAEYERFAHNATVGGLVTFQMERADCRRLKFLPYDHRTGAPATTGAEIMTPVQRNAQRNRCAAFYTERVAAASDPDAPTVEMPSMVTPIAKASLFSLTLSARTLTMCFKSRDNATFQRNGPLPGDVLWDDSSGAVFFVRSRVGLTVTADLQNNYKQLSTGSAVVLAPVALTTGNLYIGNSRVYSPPYYLRGDPCAGSSLIANVGREDGYSEWFAGEIAVGDSILIRATADRWLTEQNSTIVQCDAIKGTITVSGNCAKSGTAKRLDLFVRAPAANSCP